MKCWTKTLDESSVHVYVCMYACVILRGYSRSGCLFTHQSCGAIAVRSICRWLTATAVDWRRLKRHSFYSWDKSVSSPCWQISCVVETGVIDSFYINVSHEISPRLAGIWQFLRNVPPNASIFSYFLESLKFFFSNKSSIIFVFLSFFRKIFLTIPYCL